MPVFVPSLELQGRFAEQIDTVNSLKAANRHSLAKFDILFASLQHSAFRGELQGVPRAPEGLHDYPDIGKGAHGTPYK
ncbi:MAG: hypothetical protein PHD43_21470 [Methylococcales bacterium]|nr:hypothetical protein [Methylococcales bacterium]